MGSWPNFASPHVHPDSLDTGSTVKSFVAREVELGSGAVTATDHGTMTACRQVYDQAKKKDLIGILGIEAYLRDDDCPILAKAGLVKDAEGTYREPFKYGHFCVHCLDQAAYETCSVKLSHADARAEQHGSERKPLFTWADLEEIGAQNVTLTSGCLIGVVARHLLDRSDGRTAVAYYERMRALARPGNFYVEVFPHDCSRHWVNAIFVDLEGGERLRFSAQNERYAGKTIKVSGEIIKADQLLVRKERGVLESVKNYHRWDDLEPRQIVGVERVEGFVANECRPWMDGDPDVQASVNRFMISLARRYGDPVLVSDDAHYARPDQKIIQDVRMAQSGNWRFYGSYHRYSSDEAYAHFKATLGTSEKEFEGWLENNRAWSQRFKGFRLDTPASLPTKFYPADTLGHLRTLITRHGRMRWKDPRYVQRLFQEMELLHRNGTIDLLPYFFLAEEAVDVYNREGEIVGPGRGSAAGLLLAFLLKITHVDPLEHGLSLERFITLDRIAGGHLPDIDLDFPGRHRLEGPDGWLQKRFGDHQAQISTNMTLRLRAASKDVCRAFHGHVPSDVEELTKRFSEPPQGVTDRNHVFGYRSDDGKEVRPALEYDEALQQFVAHYPKEWSVVVECLGLNKSRSRHASAFVIMNEPVHRRIPTMTISDVVTTQYTMNDVEAMGGIKMDFLVVNSLRDIGDCVKLVQKRSGQAIPAEGVVMEDRGLVPRHQLVPHGMRLFDVWHLPDEDAVHREIVQGKTETVFQLNTPGAIGWLKHFRGDRPDGRPSMSSLRDLAYFTSLDRPGPLDMFVRDPDGAGDQKHNMLVEYAHRVRGARPSADVLPVMEKLFPETHGIMITQEQLQYAYQQLTGCTGTEAEAFRRLISKKKFEEVEKKFSFFHPMASQKIGDEEARQAWETMKVFGQYGFNMSHAVCYALIGYVCAWLKHHHPLEWWCAVLRNADKDEIASKFWTYSGHMIDLPDLGRVTPHFEVVGDRIVAPLSLLRGIGEVAHAELVAGAPYKDVADLLQRAQENRRKKAQVVRKMKRDKKTGEEKEVEVLQLGRTAIDRRVTYTALIVGAMDSLLPAEVRVAPIVDKLTYYERVFSEVTGAKRPKKVPAWYANVGPVARYVMRKKIMAAYAEDVRPILAQTDPRIKVTSPPGQEQVWYEWKNLKLADGRVMRRLEMISPLPQAGLRVAALAFVLEVRKFSYGEGKSKHAVEFMLDIDGESFKMVAWPSRESSKVVRSDVKHHLVMVQASRWADNKGFSINDLEVIQGPVTEEVEEKDDQGKGVDAAGGDRALPDAGGDEPGRLSVPDPGGDGHGGAPGQGLAGGAAA